LPVFGEDAPAGLIPLNNANLNPANCYGMSKAAVRKLGTYYYLKYGWMLSPYAYPGVIGYQIHCQAVVLPITLWIFHKAVLEEEFRLLLRRRYYTTMIFIGGPIRAHHKTMEGT